MKTRWITALLVGLVAVAMSSTAFAETRTVKKKPGLRKAGIGTALSAGGNFAPVAIFIPINLGKTFRLEPEIGFTMTNINGVNEVSGEKTNNSTQSFRLGVGAFFLQKLGATTRLYVGPRVSAVMMTIEDDDGSGNTNPISYTHMNLGASLGAEHFLTMRFSLGAEAQANVTILGEGEPDDGDSLGDDGTIISTNTLFMARFYF